MLGTVAYQSNTVDAEEPVTPIVTSSEAQPSGPSKSPSHPNRQPDRGRLSPKNLPVTLKHAAWYATNRNGYVKGYVIPGDRVVKSGETLPDYKGRGLWVAGKMEHRHHRSDDECGWVLLRSIKYINQSFKAGICSDKLEGMKDRRNLGKDFNCHDHACGGASSGLKVDKDCGNDKGCLSLNINHKTGKPYYTLPLTPPKKFHWRTLSHTGDDVIGQVYLRVKIHDKVVKLSLWPNIPREALPKKLPHNDGLPLNEHERKSIKAQLGYVPK